MAVVNDYEIVVAGIAAVLEPYSDRVSVVELAAGSGVVSDVDVVLYDSFGQGHRSSMPVQRLLSRGARVVVFSWTEDPHVVTSSLAAGAAGYVSKGSTAEQLVRALERVHAGERVVPEGGNTLELGRWPGEDHGLSAREAEVLALICQGYSNLEITEQAFIGINTVKTHIRMLYKKIEVASRTQAVVWGLAHGFEPDRTRRLTP